MEALLEVKKGERPYKCMNSPWLRDGDGPVMFRFISKLKADGRVELAYFTQRQDGRKYVLQHISFEDKEFLGVVQVIRESIWEFFPGTDLEVLDFDDIHPSSYVTAKANPLGFAKIHAHWKLEEIKRKWNGDGEDTHENGEK